MRDRLGAPARLTAIAIVTAIAIGGLFAYTNRASAEPTTSIEYAEYTNDHWHYSLAVPAGMTVSKYEPEGGGQTVQFMDATGDKELIISAWPYTQLDLTLGREGAASANSDQPDHLEIVDVVRDDLFTVLFHKNGIRYSVVTLPEYEAWLTDILTTWRFTD
jgi:hypothetical protein